MKWLFDLLDLSENLTRALLAIRHIRGTVAGVYAIGLGMPLTLVTGVLAYVFDIRATWIASQDGVTFIMRTLELDAGWWLATQGTTLVAFTITISPTLFELGGPLFARAGIVLAQTGVYALCLFDAITDGPVSNEFLMGYAGMFNKLPVYISYPLYGLVFGVWLFLASYGFELLFVIFFIVTIKLLLNAAKPL